MRINQGSGRLAENKPGCTGDCRRRGLQGGVGSQVEEPWGLGFSESPLGVQNFTASGEAEARRCARREELLARGCPAQELEEPRGRQEVLQDRPLSQGDRGEGATQLAPQRIRVTLRPGESRAARGASLGWPRMHWASESSLPFSIRGAPEIPGPLPPSCGVPRGPVLPYGPELLNEG